MPISIGSHALVYTAMKGIAVTKHIMYNVLGVQTLAYLRYCGSSDNLLMCCQFHSTVKHYDITR